MRADESDWRVQYRWLRSLVSHEMLVPYGGSRIVVPDDLAAALRERAAATREAIERAGYDVVGDLADLVDGQAQAGGRSPADVADAELLGPAEFLTVRLLERLRAEHQRAEAAERRLAAVAAAAPGAAAGPEPSGERPLGRLRRTVRGLLAAARSGNTRRTRSTGDRSG